MNKYMKIISILISLSLPIWGQIVIGGGTGGDGGGPKQSWGEIINNPNLRPSFPAHNIVGRNIKFNHLCTMGERIRTKYKQIVRNSYQQRTKIIFDYLVVDRVRQEEVCVEMLDRVCMEWETKEIEIPLKEKIEVYKRVENSTQWELAFEKMFELPECSPSFP